MEIQYNPVSTADRQKLENNFSYHAPIFGQPEKYELLRAEARKLAELYYSLCPVSRELSVAITELETSVFWANAAIARNEKLGEE